MYLPRRQSAGCFDQRKIEIRTDRRPCRTFTITGQERYFCFTIGREQTFRNCEDLVGKTGVIKILAKSNFSNNRSDTQEHK